MSETQDFVAPWALLPEGWRQQVHLQVDGEGYLTQAQPIVDEQLADIQARVLPGPVIPGMANVHSHAFQRLLAGKTHRARHAGGDSFWTWREGMYELAAQLNPDQIQALTAWLYAELMSQGYTAVGEFHYLHHQANGQAYNEPAENSLRIIQAAEETGMALTLLPVLYCYSDFAKQQPLPEQAPFIHAIDEYLKLIARCQARADRHETMIVGMAPHSLRAVGPTELKALAEADLSCPVHIHIAEQAQEVAACEAWSGQRPLSWLFDNLPVNERWCLIHATHANASEITAIARSGAIAGLCPGTEADLGDGFFPLKSLLDQGGAFGIGSDSQATLSPVTELQRLEHQARLHDQQRNRLPPSNDQHNGTWLWRHAAVHGARALGQPMGGLQSGLRADWVVLDMKQPLAAWLSPNQYLDAAILAEGLAEVNEVYVAGRLWVKQGRHIEQDALARRLYLTMGG